jgi:pimeloyl-ACP methyl ester carboxylesterase
MGEAGEGKRGEAGLRVVAILCVCVTAGCAAWTAPTAQQADRREVVVLVHGMTRTTLSMQPLARALEREGYRVINWGYSSTCCTVAELGQQLQKDIEAERGAAERIHFVGHSLGNIIVRWAFTQQQPPGGVGRVVMLAPPNQGSQMADAFAPWVGWLLKPLPELTTDSLSTARSVPVPGEVRIGVIAGERDGKVSVEETRLHGPVDHVSVPAWHTYLMYRSDVHRLVIAFLRDGRFSP